MKNRWANSKYTYAEGGTVMRRGNQSSSMPEMTSEAGPQHSSAIQEQFKCHPRRSFQFVIMRIVHGPPGRFAATTRLSRGVAARS
eukprot:1005570-Pleurochrysis_carterae.AAC.9